MGGVRPNRKAARDSRRAYLCVSAIYALNPNGSIAAFARPGDPIFSDNYHRLQTFGDLSPEAIS
jgi:hypothetical protein